MESVRIGVIGAGVIGGTHSVVLQQIAPALTQLPQFDGRKYFSRECGGKTP
jgi:hypothetical protein